MSKSTLKTEDGLSLLKEYFESKNIQDEKVCIQYQGDTILRLHHMVDPAGWLGNIMMISDMLSYKASGKRIWDVTYVVNSAEAIEGFWPVDNYTNEKADFTPYLETPLHKDLDKAEIFDYIDQAFEHCLFANKEGKYEIRPIKGEVDRPYEVGEAVDFRVLY